MIYISNISSNGEEACEYIINNTPDIILLDLKMPKLDGIQLINKLKEKIKLPEIIIISGDNSLLNKLTNLNIYISAIFTKPIDLQLLMDKLMSIKEIINNKDIEDDIIKELNSFYFNKSSHGYLYIIDCIEVCIENKKIIVPFEKNLYIKVAEKNHIKSALKVKWSIDKAISSMNKYTNPSTINEFFPNSKPTSKMFIIEIFQRISKIKNINKQ